MTFERIGGILSGVEFSIVNDDGDPVRGLTTGWFRIFIRIWREEAKFPTE